MQINNQKFNKKYKTIEFIDKGGMGEIYKCQNIQTKKICAIKFIQKSKINPKNNKKFQQEIAALSLFQSDYFMKILEYYFEDDLKCIIYEYIEGENLGVKIANRGFIPLKEAFGYMKQILEAMIIITDRGIFHRDIKPQNIIVKSNGEVVICDFGLAISGEGLELMNKNVVEGTIYFISPEVLNGLQHTEKSDIFSTGVLFFQLLFGHPPFFSNEKNDNTRNIEIKQKINTTPLPSMNFYDNQIPQALKNVIIKATAKLPNERYQNFKEFYEDFLTSLDKTRELEKPLIVSSKFIPSLFFQKEKEKYDLSNKWNLPIKYWCFLFLFFIILFGIFLWLK